MPRKKIIGNPILAFTLFAKYRIGQRMPVKEAMQKVADEVATNVNTLMARAHAERWSDHVAELKPCVVATLPISTTQQTVIEAERKTFLEISNRLADQWSKGMDIWKLNSTERSRLATQSDLMRSFDRSKASASLFYVCNR
jgi:hypothetical protein